MPKELKGDVIAGARCLLAIQTLVPGQVRILTCSRWPSSCGVAECLPAIRECPRLKTVSPLRIFSGSKPILEMTGC
jgi:hypothetical protein